MDDYNKIYPDLASAPPFEDVQTYRLKMVKEIQDFLNNEIIERSRLANKFKRFESITTYIQHGLTVTTVVSGSGSIATACTGVGIPIAACVGAIGVVTGIAGSIIKQTNKSYSAKHKKHEKIYITAQTILDGITSSISRALTDATISSEEFEKIIQEKQRYLAKKHELRSNTKKVISEINATQRQELLEQGRKEGREEIAKKLVANTDTPRATVM